LTFGLFFKVTLTAIRFQKLQIQNVRDLSDRAILKSNPDNLNFGWKLTLQSPYTTFLLPMVSISVPYCLGIVSGVSQSNPSLLLKFIGIFAVVYLVNEILQFLDRWYLISDSTALGHAIQLKTIAHYENLKAEALATVKFLYETHIPAQIHSMREILSGVVYLIFFLISSVYIDLFFGLVCFSSLIFLQLLSYVISSYGSYIRESIKSGLHSRRELAKNLISNAHLLVPTELDKKALKSATVIQSAILTLQNKKGLVNSVFVVVSDLLPLLMLLLVSQFKNQSVDHSKIVFFVASLPFLRQAMKKITSSTPPLLEAKNWIKRWTALLNDKSHNLSGYLEPDCSSMTPLISGTLTDNIVFGAPFLPGRLDKALKFVELDQDQIHPSVILSENILSGGQRARVGLARLIYAGVKPSQEQISSALSSVDPSMAARILFKMNDFKPTEKLDSQIQSDRTFDFEKINSYAHQEEPTKSRWMLSKPFQKLIFPSLFFIPVISILAEYCYNKSWKTLSTTTPPQSQTHILFIVLALVFFGFSRQFFLDFIAGQFIKKTFLIALDNCFNRRDLGSQNRKHLTDRLSSGLEELENKAVSNFSTLIASSSRTLGIFGTMVAAQQMMMIPVGLFLGGYVFCRARFQSLQKDLRLFFLAHRGEYTHEISSIVKATHFVDFLERRDFFASRLREASKKLCFAQLGEQCLAFSSGLAIRALCLGFVLIYCCYFLIFSQPNSFPFGFLLALFINLSDQIAMFEKARRECFASLGSMDVLFPQPTDRHSPKTEADASTPSLSTIDLLIWPDTKISISLNQPLKNGTVTLITGRSGMGKSSLLLGLSHAPNVKVMNQSALKKFMLVSQNAFPLPIFLSDMLSMDGQTISDSILNKYPAFATVDFVDWKCLKWDMLTTTQKKIVLLERALHSKSKHLALDEPTAGWDEGDKRVAYESIRRSAKDRMILLVTHCPLAINQFSSEKTPHE